MKRLGVWLATAVTFGSLIASSVPAAAAPLPKRTVPPVLAQQRINSSLRLPRTLTERITTALPQSPSRARGIPGAVVQPPDAFHISAQQILINQDRASNGNLPPLAWSACLAGVALANAQRVAQQGFLTHTDGPVKDMACDPTYLHAGENLGDTSVGIDDARLNTLFMGSAPHRANILDPDFHFVGTAWVIAPNGYGYIAVEFAG
jgi:uncharacterized protein YkwD